MNHSPACNESFASLAWLASIGGSAPSHAGSRPAPCSRGPSPWARPGPASGPPRRARPPPRIRTWPATALRDAPARQSAAPWSLLRAQQLEPACSAPASSPREPLRHASLVHKSIASLIHAQDQARDPRAAGMRRRQCCGCSAVGSDQTRVAGQLGLTTRAGSLPDSQPVLWVSSLLPACCTCQVARGLETSGCACCAGVSRYRAGQQALPHGAIVLARPLSAKRSATPRDGTH
jgi:hypothetical protein